MTPTLLTALAALLLASAAHAQDAAPVPAPFGAPTATASASMAAWQAMANFQAQHIAAQLADNPAGWTVRVADAHTPFARAYSRLLTSALAAHQVPLSMAPGRAPAVLEIQVDSVRFNPDYQPGTLTLLAAGAWVVHGLATSLEPAGAATALMLGTDAFLSLTGPREVELAVTLTAVAGERVVTSQSNVFLVHAHDARLYAGSARMLPLVAR